MLAQKLIRQYLVELLVYGLASALICRLSGWSYALVPLLLAAMFLGLRVLLVAATFALTETAAAPRTAEERAGLAGGLALFVVEWWAMLRAFLWQEPFQRHLSPLDPAPGTPARGLPVLLVHGFFSNGGYWQPLREQLQAAGLGPVYTINLEPLGGDIERLAAQLAARVEAILAQTACRQLVLVGHSMGGLVSRCYLHRHGGAGRVAKLITLGSPHHGTVVASRIGAKARNARQMRRDSEWLAALNALGNAVPTVSIYSLHDNLVAPQDSSALPGADNRAVSGIGHMQLLYAARIQRWVIEEIERAAPAAA